MSGFPRGDVTPNDRIELVPSPTTMWVRWQEFRGWTGWLECNSVTVSGTWLVIHPVTGGRLYVPDHIVRGRVRVEVRKSGDGPPDDE